MPLLTADDVVFDDRGLLPAVVQQHDTGEVLMLAWMNHEALTRTLATGETVFWSRSRRELWHKGATSGATQRVVDVRVDCDTDALLVLVDQHGGGACHTGERSCFGRRLATTSVVAGPAATSTTPAPGGPSAPDVRPPAPPLWNEETTP